jgi:uncharacterized surface anchored protein
MSMARECRHFLGLFFIACFVSFVSVSAQSSGTLKVTVTDNRGLPDPGAVLTLVSEDRFRKTKVNNAGEFEFTNLGFQTYELEISSPSFKDITVPNIQITSSSQKVLTITEELYSAPPGQEPAPPPCTLFRIAVLPGLGDRIAYEERTDKVNFTGTIADAVTGNPVIGATVALYKAGSPNNVLTAANSDDKGKFEFSDAAPGKYTFRVSHEAYLVEKVDFQFWITRENLTRLGRISLNPKHLQLNCDPVLGVSPAIQPNSNPPPELIPPR